MHIMYVARGRNSYLLFFFRLMLYACYVHCNLAVIFERVGNIFERFKSCQVLRRATAPNTADCEATECVETTEKQLNTLPGPLKALQA